MYEGRGCCSARVARRSSIDGQRGACTPYTKENRGAIILGHCCPGLACASPPILLSLPAPAFTRAVQPWPYLLFAHRWARMRWPAMAQLLYPAAGSTALASHGPTVASSPRTLASCGPKCCYPVGTGQPMPECCLPAAGMNEVASHGPNAASPPWVVRQPWLGCG